MRDLDQLLTSEISVTAEHTARPFDYSVIQRRAAQRRRHGAVLAVSAAAVAVVLALVGSLQLAGAPRSAPAIPGQDPSPRRMPCCDYELAPGTYLAKADKSSTRDYTLTFPARWRVVGGNEYYLNESSTEQSSPSEYSPTGIGVVPFLVDQVYADACRGEKGSVTAVGPRPRDLVTALLAQPGPVKSAPVETALGGYPATRIDLRIPQSLQTESCFLGPGTGVQIWRGQLDRYLVLGPQNVVRVYVVDVDGTRQVFTAQYGPATSQQDLAEMQQVLDSIRIRPSRP